MAYTINQGFVLALEALEEDAEQLLFRAQRLKNRVVDLRTRTSVNSSLVDAMSS